MIHFSLFRFNLFLLALAICLGPRDAFAADGSAGSGQAPEATTYQILNVKFGDLLRPRDANSANGTPIVLYSAQPWKCMTWRLQTAGESAFHLKNLFTSKTFCADTNVAAPQQNVTQLPLAKDGNSAPIWQLLTSCANWGWSGGPGDKLSPPLWDVIQVSTNLNGVGGWTSMSTNNAPVPPFYWTNATFTNAVARFYRVLLLP